MGDAEKPDFEMALVNPVILSQSSDKKLGEEGCLSFPMIYGNVERSEWIEVLTMKLICIQMYVHFNLLLMYVRVVCRYTM